MKNVLVLLVALAFWACSSGERKETEKVAAPAQMAEVQLNIGGMSCENCVASLTEGIGALKGVEKVVVTLADSTAKVSYNASALLIDDIEKVVEKRGFSVKPSK